MERMSPLDATFLYVEDGISHMHIASCAVFEGPPPAYGEVVDTVRARLPLIPRYRQVVRFVPLQLGRPVWVDDPHFRLEYHLRHTALPRPGGDRELKALMGRLMSQELDRHRPLWECWMVEGLEDDRWATITKIHHSMADGVSGVGLLGVLLDTDRRPAPMGAPESWQASPQPSALRLATDAVLALAASPYEQLRAIRRATRLPQQAWSATRHLATGAWSYARRLAPTPANSLVGSIGPDRRWTWATADLDEVRAIRGAFGGTVNDVVLAVIAGGLRDLLASRDELTDTLVLRSLVPVSVRPVDEQGGLNNLVSAIFADLPVSIADPVERLSAVHDQMVALKGSHQAEAGEGLTALGAFSAPPLVALGERAAVAIMRRFPQHSINTVTTNVPGPQQPLYSVGRQMLDYLPFVPISYGVRVGVAIVSYNGRLFFGITGDFDTVPDLEVVAHGIEDNVSRLVKLAA